MKTYYMVTSDQLSRKRGETFTDEQIGEMQAAKLVLQGHLKEVESDESADE